MKLYAILLTLLCSSFFVGNISFAEESEPQGEFQSFDQPQDGGQEGRPGGMMGGKGMKMKGKGMDMMHQQPTVVATSDGGIVILQGPKLAKYDAQLNLVNEVELKGGPKSKEGHEHGGALSEAGGVDPMEQAEIDAMLGEAPAAETQNAEAAPSVQ